MDSVVTRNGQITLPKQFRDELGIAEGSRVRFWLEDGSIIVKPASKLVWEQPGESGFTDEIVAMLEKMRSESRWRYP